MNPQEPSPTRLRFFQFGLRELLVLFALLGLLLGLLAPRLQRVYHERQFQADFRRSKEAQESLDEAVRGNDLGSARRALEAGANPNVSLSSLLHMAIEKGNVEMVELLLDFGADVERLERTESAKVVSSGPPLYAAVGCDQPTEVRLAMIRLLVERGADPRREVGYHAYHTAMDIAVYDADAEVGDLLREYGLPYGPREMAAFNRLDELKRVVHQTPGILQERYGPLYQTRQGEGRTLLGIALWNGYREMAMFLIESGAPLDTTEHLGRTPLHMAAHGGDPELIRLLVARGLDVNARDDHDDTPLCDIAWCGKPEAVAALIEAGADVNARGMNKCTPLRHAVYDHRVEIARLLLAAGADPMVPDRDGVTALDVARKRDPEILSMLEQAMHPTE